jgi:hypothetical protein
MANTFKFGNGNWAVKDGFALAYNDENNNFKPLPFEFTRASSATTLNRQGLIETVGSGKPRIDFTDNTSGHLLLEPSRTNKITYSELLSNWTQDGASTADNNTISPDGTQNASKITFSSGSKRLVFTVSSTQAIYSAYFKGVSGTQIKLRNASGAISNTITLTDEWVRYELDINASNSNVQIQSINADYVYAWGVQLEDGSYATSYIPTEGSSVTRVAEVANGAGNSTVFNASEGVLFVEIEALADDLTFRRLTISDNSYSNTIDVLMTNITNQIRVLIRDNNVTTSQMSHTVSNIVESNKVAIKYKSGNSSLWINGNNVGNISDTFTLPTLTDLSFDRGDGTSNFYGKVKNLKVYNTALTDTELQNLTS